MEQTFLSTAVIVIGLLIFIYWASKRKPAKVSGDVLIETLESIEDQLKASRIDTKKRIAKGNIELEVIESDESKAAIKEAYLLKIKNKQFKELLKQQAIQADLDKRANKATDTTEQPVIL